ncbi:MAG: dinitrogenase iron-molybdenum cofactor biosynthesis protein [Candidatus Methanoperedens sp.]|nr:dinitrogenase iron-molybdenum cofactor biosynthesis protein [Candidatus Methanoperedens sp.]
MKKSLKMAIATSDDKVINQHFGKARRFVIIESDGEEIKVLEVRENRPACGSLEYGGHADDVLEKSISLINDCDAVLCSRIGGGAAEALQSRGIEPVEAPGFIEENVLAYAKYRLKES